MTYPTTTPRAENARGLGLAELVARHPLRRRILEAIPRLELEDGDGASPVALARDLGELLGTVAYHVRTLLAAEGLELVDERRVRGAVEHFYRLTPAATAVLEDDPLVIAVGALTAIARETSDDLAFGLARGTLARLGFAAPATLAEESVNA